MDAILIYAAVATILVLFVLCIIFYNQQRKFLNYIVELSIPSDKPLSVKTLEALPQGAYVYVVPYVPDDKKIRIFIKRGNCWIAHAWQQWEISTAKLIERGKVYIERGHISSLVKFNVDEV